MVYPLCIWVIRVFLVVFGLNPGHLFKLTPSPCWFYCTLLCIFLAFFWILCIWRNLIPTSYRSISLGMASYSDLHSFPQMLFNPTTLLSELLTYKSTGIHSLLHLFQEKTLPSAFSDTDHAHSSVFYDRPSALF